MATPTHTVGLLLPQGFIRHAAVRHIGELGGYAVVAEAADAPAFRRAFALGAPPQVAVVALASAQEHGAALLHWLSKHMPTTRVLLFGEEPAPEVLLRLLCAGAYGFVCTSQGPAELGQALQHLCHGAWHFPAAVHAQLRTLHLPDPKRPAPGSIALTECQDHLLQFLAEQPHLGYAEYGRVRGIDESTVHKHRVALFKKTGCTSKAGLVKFALERGRG